MSHKKNTIPVNVLKKFNKVLFKVGDPVIINWLGEKAHGYVKEVTKSNEGVRYLVEAKKSYDKRSYRYPCGMRIGKHSTKYNSGVILYDETKQSYPGGAGKLSGDTGGQSNAFGNDNKGSGRNDDGNKRKNAKSRPNDTTTNDVGNSSRRVHGDTTTARKDTSVDDAIKKQKDFLRGFVKK